MSKPRYSDDTTLLEARQSFFITSNLGPAGGYDARWVRVETKPWPVFFPNTKARVAAAKLHDLHHIATEYDVDWPGEAEIAGFELAAGCGRYWWAWGLNIGAFMVGLLLFPRRTVRAFRRGRRANSLYHTGFAEDDLARTTVGMLRRTLNL